MKISKIFHWLYFSLLVLPLLIFLPTGLYYGFNEHAVNETTTEVDIQYKYQSNEINSLSDCIEGNIYYAESLRVADNYNDFTNMSLILYEYSSFTFNSIDDEGFDDFLYGHFSGVDTYIRLSVVPNDDMTDTWLVLTNNANFEFDYSFYYCDYTISDVVFSFSGDFVDYYTHYNNFITGLSSTNYNVIESVDVTEDVIQTIPQQMYNAWQSVWALPLFSWTSSSFILTPTSYLSGFFGIAANSSINLALTYWLSISIVWLMFDVMMYVPLLIHHYLDKAEVS